MTLNDLLEHHRSQLKAVEAYFCTDGQDGKTSKKYGQHIAGSKARVDLLEKTIDLLSALDPQSALIKTTGEKRDE